MKTTDEIKHTAFTPTPMHIDIMEHTMYRAAGGYYCGGGSAMNELVNEGLMEYAGKKSFVPDPYYIITRKGREAVRAYREPKRSSEPPPAASPDA